MQEKWHAFLLTVSTVALAFIAVAQLYFFWQERTAPFKNTIYEKKLGAMIKYIELGGGVCSQPILLALAKDRNDQKAFISESEKFMILTIEFSKARYALALIADEQVIRAMNAYEGWHKAESDQDLVRRAAQRMALAKAEAKRRKIAEPVVQVAMKMGYCHIAMERFIEDVRMSQGLGALSEELREVFRKTPKLESILAE